MKIIDSDPATWMDQVLSNRARHAILGLSTVKTRMRNGNTKQCCFSLHWYFMSNILLSYRVTSQWSMGHGATQCFRVMCISFYATCLVRSIFGCYPGIFRMVSAVGLAQQAETS